MDSYLLTGTRLLVLYKQVEKSLEAADSSTAYDMKQTTKIRNMNMIQWNWQWQHNNEKYDREKLMTTILSML